jgi:hypothetical protein
MLADYGLAIAAFSAALILTLLIRHTTGNPTFFRSTLPFFSACGSAAGDRVGS